MPSESTKNASSARVGSKPKFKPASATSAVSTPEPATTEPFSVAAKKAPAGASENANARTKIKPGTGASARAGIRAAKNPAPAGPSRPKGGLSALDAAAQVLGALPAKAAAEGLSAGDLIERMAAQRLWTSPGGKTPAATLYAAMVREISKRKGESRFRRIGPGRFAPGSASSRGGKTRNASAPATAKTTPKAPQKSAEPPAPSPRRPLVGNTSGATVS